MKQGKKLLCKLMTFVMVFSLIPVPHVYAEDTEYICGYETHEHTYEDGCYELICDLEGLEPGKTITATGDAVVAHFHGPECYGELICDIHTHNEECIAKPTEGEGEGDEALETPELSDELSGIQEKINALAEAEAIASMDSYELAKLRSELDVIAEEMAALSAEDLALLDQTRLAAATDSLTIAEAADAALARDERLNQLKAFVDTLPTLEEVRAMSEEEKDGVREMLEHFYALRDAFQPPLEDGELEESYFDKVADAEAGLSAMAMMMLAAGTHRAHPICGESCSGHTDTSDPHNNVTWTQWPQTQNNYISIPDGETKYYYLEGDVTKTFTSSIYGTLYLCLNGNTMKSTRNGIFVLPDGGKLVLCDCQESGEGASYTSGKLTGDGLGVGVEVRKGCEFIMYGGRISDVDASSSFYGVVSDSGSFIMHGGIITNNISDEEGAVYVKGGTLEINGGQIIGNKDSDGKDKNLCLANGGKVKIGDLPEDSSYGVSVASGVSLPYQISSDTITPEIAGKFFSDSRDHTLYMNDAGYLVLKEGHIHAICGARGTCSHDGHSANQEWTKVTGSSGLTAGGYCYLGSDINASVTITKDTNLCLSGRTLNGKITVSPDVTFTLCDCSGTGQIKGGSNTGVANNGIFTMYSGKITGSGDSGVKNNGTFNMYDGTITGNKAATAGGGVYNDTVATFNLYGGDITGNTLTNGTKSNVFGTITVQDTVDDENTDVGICTGSKDIQAPCVFTQDGVDPDAITAFTADTAGASVLQNRKGALYVLKFDHKHAYKDGDGEVINWTPILELEDLKSMESGKHYALTNHFEVDEKIQINGTVGLCLNSHTLTSTAASGYAIEVAENGTLNLCDCSEGHTGKIEGVGGGILNNGSLTLYGGKIPVNNAEYYSVKNAGKLTLNGSAVELGTVHLTEAAEPIEVLEMVDGSIGVTFDKVPTANAPVQITNGGGDKAEQFVISDKYECQVVENNILAYMSHKHDGCGTTEVNLWRPIRKVEDWNAMINGGYYYLAEDLNVSGLEIPAEKTVNLCLNGHSWTSEGSNQMVNKGTLNICDCVQNSTGMADAVINDGTLHLYSGHIDYVHTREALATFTMESGIVGGVDNYSGTTTIKGGTIEDIYNLDGNFHLKGGELLSGDKIHSNCSSSTATGNIYIYKDAKIPDTLKFSAAADNYGIGKLYLEDGIADNKAIYLQPGMNTAKDTVVAKGFTNADPNTPYQLTDEDLAKIHYLKPNGSDRNRDGWYFELNADGEVVLKDAYIFTLSTLVDRSAHGVVVDENAYTAEGYKFYAKDLVGNVTELTPEGESYYVASLKPGQYAIWYGNQPDRNSDHVLLTIQMENQNREEDSYFYSVTYDYDGGVSNGKTANTYYVPSGMKHKLEAAPIKDGSELDHWNAGDKYDPETEIIVKNTMGIKAVWTDRVGLPVSVTVDTNAYKKSTNDSYVKDPSAACDGNTGTIVFILESKPKVGGNWTDTGYKFKYMNGDFSGFATDANHEDVKHDNMEVKPGADGIVTFTSGELPVFTNLLSNMQYRVVVERANYYLEDYPAINGDANIKTLEAKIIYTPDLFTMTAELKADSSIINKIDTVTVKYLVYNASDSKWEVLKEHNGDNLGITKEVPGNVSYDRLFKTGDNGAYLYNLMIDKITLTDGTELLFAKDGEVSDDTITYKGTDHGYEAVVLVTGSEVYGTQNGKDVYGVYYNKAGERVQGTATVTLKASGAKKITLDANGGQFADGATNKEIKVADKNILNDLPAVGKNASAFGGWYKGNTKITAFTQVKSGDTLTAHWNDDAVMVPVEIIVDGFYDPKGGTAYVNMHDDDLPKEVKFIVSANGVQGNPTTVPVSAEDWKEIEINGLKLKQAKISTSVAVSNITEDTYTITLDTPKNHKLENAVTFDKTADSVTMHLEFKPAEYAQSVKLDISEIGQKALLKDVGVVVTYKNTSGDFDDISQNIPLKLNGATTEGSVNVWVYPAGGSAKMYVYSARVTGYNDANIDDAPFAIASITAGTTADYVNESYVQKAPITIKLEPKQYAITTDEGITGTHTWSIDTVLADALEIPEIADGKVFAGWKMEGEATDKILVAIPAATEKAIKLEAVWKNTTDGSEIGTSDTEYTKAIFVDKDGDGKDIVGVPVKEVSGKYQDAAGNTYTLVTMVDKTQHYVPNGVLEETDVAGVYTPNKLNQPVYMSVAGSAFHELKVNDADHSYTDHTDAIFIPYESNLLSVVENTTLNDGTYYEAAAPTDYYIPYGGEFVKGTLNSDNTYTDSEGYTYQKKDKSVFEKITARLHTIQTKLDGTLHAFGRDLYVKAKNGTDAIKLTEVENGNTYQVRLDAGVYEFYYNEGGENVIVKTCQIYNEAVTEDINWYTVSYAGTPGDGGTLPESAIVLENASYAVDSPAPVRADSFFRGWVYNGGTTLYQAGETFKVTGTTTLTAQWEAKISKGINLTIDPQAYDVSGDPVVGTTDTDYANKEFVVTLQQKAENGAVWADALKVTLKGGIAASSSDDVNAAAINYATSGNVYTYSGDNVFNGLDPDYYYRLVVDRDDYVVKSSSEDANGILSMEMHFASGQVTVSTDVSYMLSGKAEGITSVNVMYQRYDDTNGWVDASNNAVSGTFTDAEASVRQYVFKDDFTRVRVDSITVGTQAFSFNEAPEAYKGSGKTVVYGSSEHGYKAEVTVTGGTLSGGDGSLYAVKEGVGTITVVINNTGMKNVTLDANGGTIGNGGSTQTVYLMQMSDLNAYIPTREGYTFVGWKPENGGAKIEKFADIKNNDTLKAEWDDNFKNVEVTITVNGYYDPADPVGGTNYVTMHEDDRPLSAKLFIVDSGTKQPIDNGDILLNIAPKDWSDGEQPKAVLTKVVSVPDVEGAKYEIRLDEGSMKGYTLTNTPFKATAGTTAVRMSFGPVTYEQSIQFDASAIKNGKFEEASVAIYFKDSQGNFNEPVAQMDSFTFTEQTATATADVWVFLTNGKQSSYRPKLVGWNGEEPTEVPFTVSYEPVTGGVEAKELADGSGYVEDKPMKVILTPNTYAIKTNKSVSAKYTWSIGVGVEDFSEILPDPKEEGKIFLGWKDFSTGEYITSISADRIGEIQLVAEMKEIAADADPAAPLEPGKDGTKYRIYVDETGEGTVITGIEVSTKGDKGTYEEGNTLYIPVTMLNGTRHFVAETTLEAEAGIYTPVGKDEPFYMRVETEDSLRFAQLEDNGNGTYTDGETNYIPDQDEDGKPEPDTNGDGVYEGTNGEKIYIPVEDENGETEYISVEQLDNPPGAYKPESPEAGKEDEIYIPNPANPDEFIPVVPDEDHPGAYNPVDPGTGEVGDDILIPDPYNPGKFIPVEPVEVPANGFKDGEGNIYIPVKNEDGEYEIVPAEPYEDETHPESGGAYVNPDNGQVYVPVENEDGKIEYVPVEPSDNPPGSYTPIDPETGKPVDPGTGEPTDDPVILIPDPYNPGEFIPVEPSDNPPGSYNPIDPGTGEPTDDIIIPDPYNPGEFIPVEPGDNPPGSYNPIDPGTGEPTDDIIIPDPYNPGEFIPVEPSDNPPGSYNPIDPGTGEPTDDIIIPDPYHPGGFIPVEPDPDHPGAYNPVDPGTGEPVDPGTGEPTDDPVILIPDPYNPGGFIPVEPGDNPPGSYTPIDPETGKPVDPSTGEPTDDPVILIPDPYNPGEFIPVEPDPDHPGAYKPVDPGTGEPTDDPVIIIPDPSNPGEFIPVEPVPGGGYTPVDPDKPDSGEIFIPVIDPSKPGDTPTIKPAEPTPGGAKDPVTGQEYIYVDIDGDGIPNVYIPVTPNANGIYADSTGTTYKPVDADGDGKPDYYVPVKKGSGGGSSGGGGGGGTSTNVKVTATENGDVVISNPGAGKGDTVIITVKPDAGYELDELKVTDKEGKEIEVKDLGDNKYSFVSPGGKVNVKATYRLIEEAVAEAITLENYDPAKAIILKVGVRFAMVFGVMTPMDVAPIIRNDRTMLPIRIVAESLGAKVEWYEPERKVTIIKGDSIIEITIDSNIAKINGEDVVLDAPAFIENDRTYLPMRFVAENLDATVLWDANERQAIIIPNTGDTTVKVEVEEVVESVE